ncbi:hypothetical protein ASPSYDRAFT_1173355 [Aspergillus sydowii CBS 593.65]|uniref:Uncharacterized protein n=1 Tax=Aspergillus sydowii CBS 593.65 TaxID=1036612 RepID=A0A1L9TQ38_9EURO|nr:uncharacterized protein ASPSYDRAFT_1173355 [Aspergillus sydowii CBS 593.65]OJJ61559.1 hypothetical protein ASPSYDRAFT_1173355 [Aspergillus sydowii CBS 593.65]
MSSAQTTVSRPRILDLPDELLIMIFEYLWSDGPNQPSTRISSSAIDATPAQNNDLAAVACTCKRFLDLAPEYLSRRVILRRSTDASLLLSRLRSYPQLARRVEKLVVYQYSDIPGQVAAEKPRSPEMMRLWGEMQSLKLFRFVAGASHRVVYSPGATFVGTPFQLALIAAISSLPKASWLDLRARFLPKLKDFHVCSKGLAAWECAVGAVMSLPEINTFRLDAPVDHPGILLSVTLDPGASSTLRQLIITTPWFHFTSLSGMIRSIARLETLHLVYRIPSRADKNLDEFHKSLYQHRQSLRELKLTDELSCTSPSSSQFGPIMWTGYHSLTTLHVPDYLLFRAGYDTSDIRRLWAWSLISLGIVPWQSGYLNTVLILEELL